MARSISVRARRTGSASCRARGRLHPAVDPDEQRIVEQIAQPAQRLAQGRLAQADAGTGTGYVAFGDQGVESDKQVEVDGVQDRHESSI
jgi:hypothetical protein